MTITITRGAVKDWILKAENRTFKAETKDLAQRPFAYVSAGLKEKMLKDDRQRFLQKVSKKQFRTVYYNANACG